MPLENERPYLTRADRADALPPTGLTVVSDARARFSGRTDAAGTRSLTHSLTRARCARIGIGWFCESVQSDVSLSASGNSRRISFLRNSLVPFGVFTKRLLRTRGEIMGGGETTEHIYKSGDYIFSVCLSSSSFEHKHSWSNDMEIIPRTRRIFHFRIDYWSGFFFFSIPHRRMVKFRNKFLYIDCLPTH